MSFRPSLTSPVGLQMSKAGPTVEWRPTLKQRCSCSAAVEIPADSWSPNDVILEWFATHPCPNRPKDPEPRRALEDNKEN